MLYNLIVCGVIKLTFFCLFQTSFLINLWLLLQILWFSKKKKGQCYIKENIALSNCVISSNSVSNWNFIKLSHFRIFDSLYVINSTISLKTKRSLSIYYFVTSCHFMVRLVKLKTTITNFNQQCKWHFESLKKPIVYIK